jgi:hypothetical protein
MSTITRKNKPCNNNRTIKMKSLISPRARSSPTNTMWALMPDNQSYQRMRKENQEEEQLKTQKTLLKNVLRKKIKNIQDVQNKIIYAEKNKQNIASKYDDDDEVAGINETWKTCEGDYTRPLRKSPTMKNLKDLVGGKKYKKKTHKHSKKKKPIPYKRKSIKYK